MSKNSEAVKTPEIKTPTAFNVRNIKKEYNKATKYEVVDKQFHLELGENYETKIVQDRNVDWQELANKDIDKVGLANVLELARRRGDPLANFAFKDSEAMDLSGLDPMQPQDVAKVASGASEADAKLEALAKQIGISKDALVDAFIKGTLADVIAANTQKEETPKTEGGAE